MLTNTINLTPAAIEDIQSAVDYYNSRSVNLGFQISIGVTRSVQFLPIKG